MKIDLLIGVLRETCTINQVRDAIRSLGVTVSGATWDDFISATLKPALKSGQLSEKEALALLREIEEHGDQHVFLYTVDPKAITRLFERKILRQLAKAANLDDRIENPLLLDKPSKRTVSEIRWDDDGGTSIFVLKAVMKHEHQELAGTDRNAAGQTVRVYNNIDERMVDVLRVAQNGVVEVRLGRRTSVSTYEEYLEHFWKSAAPFLGTAELKDVSLTRAKNYLLVNRSSLSGQVQYHMSTLGNDYGYSARFAAGPPEADLNKDDACKGGVDAFYQYNGHCKDLNISLKKQGKGLPTRDLRVKLAGHVNEFVLTQRMDQAEYEYVVAQLRKFNQ